MRNSLYFETSAKDNDTEYFNQVDIHPFEEAYENEAESPGLIGTVISISTVSYKLFIVYLFRFLNKLYRLFWIDHQV